MSRGRLGLGERVADRGAARNPLAGVAQLVEHRQQLAGGRGFDPFTPHWDGISPRREREQHWSSQA